MKKKIIILIIIITISSIPFFIKNIKASKEEVVNAYLINDISKDILLYNEPNNQVMGTIEFIRHNQINEIKLGTTDDILNEHVVGLHEKSVNLDNRPNNIILAAHNKKGLFRVITSLKIKDQIKITSILHEYYFEVIKIEKYDKNYLMPFNIDDNVLTLITCIENNHKRLIVTLKEI